MPNPLAAAFRRIRLAAEEWAALDHLTPGKRAMARTLAATAARLAAAADVSEEDLAAVKLITCKLHAEVTGQRTWSSCPFGLCRAAREGTQPPPFNGSEEAAASGCPYLDR